MAIRFGIRGDSIQLDQLLKATGLAESGGAAKGEVAAGLVKVDGQVELRKRATLRPGQVVEFGGETIELEPGTAADAAPMRTPRPKKAPVRTSTPVKAPPSKRVGTPARKPAPHADGQRSAVEASVVGHGRDADTKGGGATRPAHGGKTSRPASRSGGQKRRGARSTPKSKPSKA